MRLLPHLVALQSPHITNADHVIRLHVLEDGAQCEVEQAGEEDERDGAEMARGGCDDNENLQRDGEEAGQPDHGRNGRARAGGLRGQAGVAGGDEGEQQGEGEGHERDDEDGKHARDGEALPHVKLVR